MHICKNHNAMCYLCTREINTHCAYKCTCLKNAQRADMHILLKIYNVPKGTYANITLCANNAHLQQNAMCRQCTCVNIMCYQITFMKNKQCADVHMKNITQCVDNAYV